MASILTLSSSTTRLPIISPSANSSEVRQKRWRTSATATNCISNLTRVMMASMPLPLRWDTLSHSHNLSMRILLLWQRRILSMILSGISVRLPRNLIATTSSMSALPLTMCWRARSTILCDCFVTDLITRNSSKMCYGKATKSLLPPKCSMAVRSTPVAMSTL